MAAGVEMKGRPFGTHNKPLGGLESIYRCSEGISEASLSTFSPGRSIFSDWGNWYALRGVAHGRVQPGDTRPKPCPESRQSRVPAQALRNCCRRAKRPVRQHFGLGFPVGQRLAKHHVRWTIGRDRGRLDQLGASSGLQDQVQSAVSAAIESAEQAGGGNLKTTVYNSRWCKSSRSNGIDPKTFQATGTGSSSRNLLTVDSTTSSVLSQGLPR